MKRARFLMRSVLRISLMVGVFTFFLLFSQSLIPQIRLFLLQTGFITEEIFIAGTGSMYPTFPKGEGDSDITRAQAIVAWPLMKAYPTGFEMFGKRFFSYKIQQGDIVSFSNKKTDEITAQHYKTLSGFVKRVIGLPGDTIEIRDGFVKINGEIIQEPYIAKPRSSYGGEFLSDCQVLTIPQKKLFVMGDNRKESLDSRNELELISIDDVDHVIPIDEQDKLKANWRDTSNDLKNANKPSLDVNAYIALLNDKRKEFGAKPLSYNEKLEQSAFKRGQAILRFNDLSFEATRSGFTQKKAFEEVGYFNIVTGESPVLGFYDAQELIENFSAFPSTKKFLLNKDYQETGVAVVLGQINGCPTQAIVQHLGGYVPPNYKQDDITSWKKLAENLREVLPSWENAKQNSVFYDKNKEKVDRMVSIIKLRIDRTDMIVSRMEQNQWLTSGEEKFAQEDATLHAEQERLAKELNEEN